MRSRTERPISAVLRVAIYLTGLVFCVDIYAQGPINNALQFQEKAVKTALKNPKRQNFKSKKDDDIEWTDKSASNEGDTSGEDDNAQPISPLINVK